MKITISINTTTLRSLASKKCSSQLKNHSILIQTKKRNRKKLNLSFENSNLENKKLLVLGDFVESSTDKTGQAIGIVGIKSEHILYVKVDQRRSTNCVKVTSEDLQPVKGTYRILLHFKTDKY